MKYRLISKTEGPEIPKCVSKVEFENSSKRFPWVVLMVNVAGRVIPLSSQSGSPSGSLKGTKEGKTSDVMVCPSLDAKLCPKPSEPDLGRAFPPVARTTRLASRQKSSP